MAISLASPKPCSSIPASLDPAPLLLRQPLRLLVLPILLDDLRPALQPFHINQALRSLIPFIGHSFGLDAQAFETVARLLGGEDRHRVNRQVIATSGHAGERLPWHVEDGAKACERRISQIRAAPVELRQHAELSPLRHGRTALRIQQTLQECAGRAPGGSANEVAIFEQAHEVSL